MRILLQEQGRLCAFCERAITKVGGTIEHFFPKSIFPHLQLDYHNLYVTCGGCNQPKGDHLIPAYIFDPRFDPCSRDNLWGKPENIKTCYSYNDGKCRIDAQNTHNYATNLLHSTLELTQQNRADQKITHSLIHQRGAVHTAFSQTIAPKLTKEQLLQKWKNIESLRNDPAYHYDEFISLKVFLLAQAMKSRGITLADL